MKGIFWLILVLVIILAIGGTLWGTYNSLVTRSNAVDAQWSQVETQYQRRYDLIPNLVNSVKGYMAQEQTIFQQITDARTKYGSAATTDEKAVASSEMESAVSRLLVIMENYPVLPSVDVVVQLMDELAGTENRISLERGRYNTEVRDYNTIPDIDTAQRLQDMNCCPLIERLIVVAAFRERRTGRAPVLAVALPDEVERMGGNFTEKLICLLRKPDSSLVSVIYKDHRAARFCMHRDGYSPYIPPITEHIQRHHGNEGMLGSMESAHKIMSSGLDYLRCSIRRREPESPG